MKHNRTVREDMVLQSTLMRHYKRMHKTIMDQGCCRAGSGKGIDYDGWDSCLLGQCRVEEKVIAAIILKRFNIEDSHWMKVGDFFVMPISSSGYHVLRLHFQHKSSRELTSIDFCCWCVVRILGTSQLKKSTPLVPLSLVVVFRVRASKDVLIPFYSGIHLTDYH